ncbi:MAG: sulfate transport system permease protein 1 [Bradyrhizobium sp.]|nr:sulfate transport system permease protein 1 [Bradyrhizobium sp.]
MSIHIQQISKRFNNFVALDRVNLEVPSGELVALLGPSGSGKTTLLRVIAGLEQPDSGQILLGGEDATTTQVQDRRVGFVFQHYALFRHMTIFENVAFGLRVRPRGERPSDADIRRRVHELLELVQLDWQADRYPHQLSGGQRQRIALARALAIEPKVLLLDEPFGALDAKVRKELRRWLRRLHDEIHLTSVFVTHDQDEALEVADRIVVFNHGRIEQIGTPAEVYENPVSPFVIDFLGRANRFTASGGQHAAYARPHEIEVSSSNLEGGATATVEHFTNHGPLVQLALTNGAGDTVEVDLFREQADALALTRGQQVYYRPRALRVFPEVQQPEYSI